jgi:hypothetical protein
VAADSLARITIDRVTPRVLAHGPLLLLLLAACQSTAAREGPAADVHALTGAHTRAVWVQGDGTDPYALGKQLVLMGFDTDDGRGERAIAGERGSYVKPMLTPRGDRVVFSTHPDLADASVFIVNFDGSGLRRFDRGFALAVWEHPNDGSEWIYIGSNYKGQGGYSTVTRVRIDRPSEREEVWNGDTISIDTFQVSADGVLAGGLFPWPAAGVADLRRRGWKQFGEGCWTALNDAGTPLLWYFDGAHRNLTMVDVARDRRWTVPINRAPGFENPEVYHPRWTRHPRFMTMTGPYNRGGANQVRSGGTQAEVWLGRFNGDFTAIEAWARVTSNTGGDSYPDVWIDRARSPHPQLASGRIGPAGPPRPAVAPDRIVVDARVAGVGEVPTPESIVPYRHALVVNRYEIVKVLEGTPAGRELAVAQWAIRNARVLEESRRSVGEVRRLTLERYEAHPELEGERLIQGDDVAKMPLYYDISGQAARR